MGWTTAYKNSLLDGDPLEPNLLSLHDGDPGASGTSNEVTGGSYAREAATFAAATSAERALSGDVAFSGPALQSVTHVGIWNSTGPTFLGSFERSSGDTAFNAA